MIVSTARWVKTYPLYVARSPFVPFNPYSGLPGKSDVDWVHRSQYEFVFFGRPGTWHVAFDAEHSCDQWSSPPSRNPQLVSKPRATAV